MRMQKNQNREVALQCLKTEGAHARIATYGVFTVTGNIGLRLTVAGRGAVFPGASVSYTSRR
jgi:hypothetical protein